MQIWPNRLLFLPLAALLMFALPGSLNADTVVFDPDGTGNSSVPMDTSYFQFGAGNSLAQGIIPFTTSTTFQLLFHAQLNSIVTTTGAQFTPTGLNTSNEITIVGSLTERVVAVNAGPPQRVVYRLATNQAPESFVELYYNSPPGADALAGTGYNNGTLILQGRTPATTPDVGTFVLTDPQPNPAPNFDVFGLNNYAMAGTGGSNVTSVVGTGSTRLNVVVNYVNPDFFPAPGGGPSGMQVKNGDTIVLELNQAAPFDGVNPSRAFTAFHNTNTDATPTPSPSPPAATPRIGSVNGVSGPDLQTESLIGFSITAGFTPTPTPTPSATPSATPSPTPIVSPSPTPTPVGPKVIVQASRTQLREGADSTITFSTNQAVHPDLHVNYSVSGSATLNVDYTLSGTPGVVVIPANQSSASIILHSIPDSIREPNGEPAVIAIAPGTSYQVPANKAANRVVVLILDRNG